MPKTYTELYYHFVWSTRDRAPLITEEIEPHLFRQIRHKCQELQVRVHALNAMPDHVHLACTLPTSLSVADAVAGIKGSSAHFITQVVDQGWILRWQEGYGALTFAKRDLPTVVAYIDGQKTHHSSGEVRAVMERVDETG
ncbi:MAG: IS200/IS605 family transposase [Actinomycetota bacterium]